MLEVQGIGKRFAVRRGLSPREDFVALEDLSFSIAAGEVLGLVGESGSGKSTCAKIVLGLLEPDAGTVRLLGQPWSGISEAARRPLRPRLQYIPQDPLSSFDPRYRVSQVIAENLQGLPRAMRRSSASTTVRSPAGVSKRTVRPSTSTSGTSLMPASPRSAAADGGRAR
ncbi:ATP-binding cassette domain-containing protein [Variovorax sp. CT11-76]